MSEGPVSTKPHAVKGAGLALASRSANAGDELETVLSGGPHSELMYTEACR